MYKYLLNVTFYAGSDTEEDTDKGMYILCSDKKITKTEMKKIFKDVNDLLNFDYEDEEENDFPISYEDGLNIHTLMDGIEIYLKTSIKCIESLKDECGPITIDNYYVIEQWQ